ncbi:UNVERIFIED_CONTAM: hypothetical protein RMT77_012036 [Armadillidium vulgare]
MSRDLDENILWSDNIFINFNYMITNKIESVTLVSYAFRSSLYKYGRIQMDFDGIKFFALSSVIPLEPDLKMIEIDMILFQLSFLDMDTYLLITIDGLEEKLEILLNTSDDLLPILQKIIYGEIKLKSKYLSEIFVYGEEDSGENEEIMDLITFGEDSFDKIYIVPENSYVTGDLIGEFRGDRNFLKQIICSKCHYRINDLYFQIKTKRDRL